LEWVVSLEDDLETDVASLRRELLDWILTEVRSGRDRQSLAGAPLAQDLVDVVRGGLKGAADEAAQRIENQRAETLVKALEPTFQRLSQDLRALHASLSTELTSRGGDADARLAGLERAIADVRQGLKGRAAAGGPDRTDEILKEIRRLGGEAPRRARGRRAEAEPSAAERWTPVAVVALAVGMLVVGAAGGWVLGGRQTGKLAPDQDVADQAQGLRGGLGDLAAASPGGGAPTKVDAQTVAADAADAAGALEAAANATTPEGLHDAHARAVQALAQLRTMLETPSHAATTPPAETAQPSAPTPAPAQPRPAPTRHVSAASSHAAASGAAASASGGAPPAASPSPATGGSASPPASAGSGH
jgi:hypothetical protein